MPCTATRAEARSQPPFASATTTVVSPPASTQARVRATSVRGSLPTLSWNRSIPADRRPRTNSAIAAGSPSGTAS